MLPNKSGRKPTNTIGDGVNIYFFLDKAISIPEFILIDGLSKIFTSFVIPINVKSS